ncbi:hypothetical protein EB52_00871 [Enterococcus faecalis]|uniref:hypothetical protein n=1 Tax=Enterococcus faecalis TaxID=1351 RepID=UPI000DE87BDA|nr:hypothetical protein [Enterococcus faecalis]RBR80170.1 hypothetical protein EB52_00871 [Enterococcus faecalis]
MVKELLVEYRQLTSSQKLFFELLAFVYIGSRNGKGIAIETQTIKKVVNGEIKHKYVYMVVVNEEDN